MLYEQHIRNVNLYGFLPRNYLLIFGASKKLLKKLLFIQRATRPVSKVLRKKKLLRMKLLVAIS